MSQATEIIVYRNPMEKAMWDGVSAHPEIFLAVLASGVIAVLAAVFFDKFLRRYFGWKTAQTYQLWFMAVAGVGSFVAFMRYL